MTETTTFPFSSLQEEVTADGDEQRRPFAAILGGGLLAVALVGGAVFAFTGGDDELPVAAGAASTAAGPDAAAPPVAAELEQKVPPANADSIAETRNPFDPKYLESTPVVETPAVEPAQPPAGDPAAVPPNLVVPDPPSQAPAPMPAEGSTGAPPAAGAPAAPVAAPREYRLVLTGVSTDGGVPTASFTIDGAVSLVKATEIFGPQRQLLLRSLQQGPADGQWTATLQVGDARPIDVVTGEAVYVQ
jgi:hypothetical protein